VRRVRGEGKDRDGPDGNHGWAEQTDEFIPTLASPRSGPGKNRVSVREAVEFGSVDENVCIAMPAKFAADVECGTGS
jgi:hypothetical protein